MPTGTHTPRTLPEDIGPTLVAGALLALVALSVAVAPIAGAFDDFVSVFFARYALSVVVGLALVAAARRVAGDGLLGLAGPRIKGPALIGAGVYLAALPGILWVHQWNEDNVLGGEERVQETLGTFLSLIEAGEVVVVAAMTTVLVVVVPLLEEIVFRGWLMSGVRESIVRAVGEPGASSVAVLVSTAVFVGVHAQFTWLPIAVMGIILAVLYAKTRTLWPGIVFHGLHNLFTLYYPVFDK